MMKIDRELSQRIAKTLGTETLSAWRTAWLALRRLPDMEKAFYVEGWAVKAVDSTVIEHGWLEIDGRIVDPTAWDRELAYFPALRFDRRQILAALPRTYEFPLSWRGGAHMRESLAYRRVWREACALAESRIVP